MVIAVAYVRTSSLGNSGEQKDSYQRQKQAITTYAQQHNITLGKEKLFYDQGISGTLPVVERPAFQSMLNKMDDFGATIILVEDATRLARDLMVQEVTLNMCENLGFKVVTVKAPESLLGNDMIKKLVRHVIGAVAEFQRSEVVERLRHARQEKLKTTKSRTLTGKPKVTGKKNRLEGKDGPAIKKALGKWTSRPKLQKGDLSKARAMLTAKGIRTENGEEVSYAQVATWIKAGKILKK